MPAVNIKKVHFALLCFHTSSYIINVLKLNNLITCISRFLYLGNSYIFLIFFWLLFAPYAMYLLRRKIICPNNNLIIRKCIRFTKRHSTRRFFKKVSIKLLRNEIVNCTLHIYKQLSKTISFGKLSEK